VGFYGMGAVTDLGVDIQAAEKEIERKFTSTAGDGEVHELKDMGRAGREKDL
jgi:IS5 family transposase